MNKNTISTVLTTIVTLAILLLGWQQRDEYWYTAERGLGYAFGITGGSMMLLLLLYPARKYWKPMRNAFKVHYWFKMHMLFGLWGPVLIMLHSNFGLGSRNSSIALFSMLLVAGSGLIGRYVYQKLHRGLYGKQVEFSELDADYQSSKAHFSETPLFTAEVQDALYQIESHLTRPKVSLATSVGAGRNIKVIQNRSKLLARELTDKADHNEDELALLTQGIAHWNSGLKKLRKMASYALYARLFSLWHIFHLPLFIMMIITAIVHIFVVHIY